jgi:hypothetical protein
MPGIFSKYKKTDVPPSFGKLVTRETPAIGMDGQGLEGKKEKFLQDYDFEFP